MTRVGLFALKTAFAASIILVAASGAFFAQYPDRPIKFILPFLHPAARSTW